MWDFCHNARSRLPLPRLYSLVLAARLVTCRPDASYRGVGGVKFGGLADDAGFLGGKEHGVDLNPELIMPSPVTDAWAASLPGYLRWMVQPRPTFGVEANTSGYTNQFYFGTTWTWQLFGNVIQPGDGITAGIFFGG